MRKVLARFIRDDEGQDLIEYGLLAGIITAGAISTAWVSTKRSGLKYEHESHRRLRCRG